MSKDRGSPCLDVLHGLSESSIEDSLKTVRKLESNDDVCNCHFVTDKPLLALEMGVESFDVSFKVLGGLIPVILGYFSPAEDAHVDNHS